MGTKWSPEHHRKFKAAMKKKYGPQWGSGKRGTIGPRKKRTGTTRTTRTTRTTTARRGQRGRGTGTEEMATVTIDRESQTLVSFILGKTEHRTPAEVVQQALARYYLAVTAEHHRSGISTI